MAQEATDNFDLQTGPLIRGRLIALDSEHVLLLTMHHIVSDGWSMGVLVRELSASYTGYVEGGGDLLPTPAIQYADYASWQRRWLSGELLQAQSAYWRRALGDASMVLDLPSDRPRPTEQSHAGGRLGVSFNAELTAKLRTLSQRHGVTLFIGQC